MPPTPHFQFFLREEFYFVYAGVGLLEVSQCRDLEIYKSDVQRNLANYWSPTFWEGGNIEIFVGLGAPDGADG